MIITIFIFFAVSVGITGAASPGISQWNPYSMMNVPSPDRYNYFDAELLEVVARHENGNILISPLAVKVALEMLMEGANGRSAEEIRTALRLNPKDGNEKPQQQNLYSFRNENGTDVVKLASRIFVAENYNVNPEYRTSLHEKFNGEISQVRFQQPRELAQIINDWVKNATSGMIKKIAEERRIQPETKLMLANAIYFRGKWLHPFGKESTFIKCFKTSEKDCISVPMMMESGSYHYAYIAKLDAEAINIPYQDERLSILLLLPKKVNGCRQLSRDLIHVSLEDIVSELQQEEIHVEIPKFTIEFNKDLRPYLQKLQIHQVFTSGADLSGIFGNSKERISVNEILHSAKLEVDEEGTEAAAAIGSLFVPLMGGAPIAFVADHPFLFFLRDTKTGAVLFSGRLVRPEPVLQKNFTNNGKNYEFDLNEEHSSLISTFRARPNNPGKTNYQDGIKFNNYRY